MGAHSRVSRGPAVPRNAGALYPRPRQSPSLELVAYGVVPVRLCHLSGRSRVGQGGGAPAQCWLWKEGYILFDDSSVGYQLIVVAARLLGILGRRH